MKSGVKLKRQRLSGRLRIISSASGASYHIFACLGFITSVPLFWEADDSGMGYAMSKHEINAASHWKELGVSVPSAEHPKTDSTS
jgi:hypothetical protein